MSGLKQYTVSLLALMKSDSGAARVTNFPVAIEAFTSLLLRHAHLCIAVLGAMFCLDLEIQLCEPVFRRQVLPQ